MLWFLNRFNQQRAAEFLFLRHRGYNTGFISMWISFISSKFIANIMNDCLLWRSTVTQTTCFLDKMSSRTKQEPRPFLPTTAQPTTQLSQRLHDYGRPLDQFVWCRLNLYFERPSCARPCCSCYPDVGDISSCVLPRWKEKSVSYNMKNKQPFKKKMFSTSLFSFHKRTTHVSLSCGLILVLF